jgi:hypothetical protein
MVASMAGAADLGNCLRKRIRARAEAEGMPFEDLAAKRPTSHCGRPLTIVEIPRGRYEHSFDSPFFQMTTDIYS